MDRFGKERNDVQALRADVRSLEQRVAALEADQQDDDAALLTAIADVVGARVFDASELLTATKLFPNLADALDGFDTPQRIGQRLSRLARGGRRRGLQLRLHSKRTERGCSWYVELHEPARSSDAPDV